MAAFTQQLTPGVSQQQRQTQSPALSELAQQRLKLLPLQVNELTMFLRQRAEANPFLEFEPPVQTESFEELRDAALSEDPYDADGADYLLNGREGYGDDRDPETAAEAAARHDRLILSQTEPLTLYRHLELQVKRLLPPGAKRDLALLVCDALDDDGYLRTPIAELESAWWESCGGRPLLTERADIEAAVRLVQSLDPVGVGARSPEECLLLQVKADPAYDVTRDLRIRLCHALNAILTESPEQMARRLRCTVEEYRAALASLRQLSPYPGRAFAPKENPEQPEIVAVQDETGRWCAICDERLFPLFRVDEASVKRAREGVATPDDRKWITQQTAEARLLVAAYHERNETLRRVAQAVFDHQPAFLAAGGDPAHLRPLLQRDIAREIGYDESIISRTVKDKSVRLATAAKPIPFKAFFTHALPQSAGAEGAVSDQQVKQAIKELIAEENPACPLSDQALTERLAAKGMPLARRTVAKYREGLGIPSTRDRKKRHT